MSPERNEKQHEKVDASIKLTRKIDGDTEVFALAQVLDVPGPCDGKHDGESCGHGCTCLSGQPWYNREGLQRLGIEVEPSGETAP